MNENLKSDWIYSEQKKWTLVLRPWQQIDHQIPHRCSQSEGSLNALGSDEEQSLMMTWWSKGLIGDGKEREVGCKFLKTDIS